jgi:HEAT repeat protein
MKIALAAALVIIGTTPVFAETNYVERTEKLAAVLKSEAPQKEKADACRELAVMGTQEALGALSSLLQDEKLGHMARYSLETMPNGAVDSALLQALGQRDLKSALRIGIIGSLGRRQVVPAIRPLTTLLRDENSEVVFAASRALGSIGTSESAKTLLVAWANTPAPQCYVFAEGLLRAAEALAAKGQRTEALAIYDRLRDSQAPLQVRVAGLRGSILTREEEGLPILAKALRGDDFAIFDAAVRVSMEMPGTEVTQLLIQLYYSQKTADRKLVLLQEWGRRGDSAVVEHLARAANTLSQPKAIRLEALRSLPRIGTAETMEPLLGAIDDKDREIAQAALDGLAGLPGKEVDAVVAKMLGSSDPAQKQTGIELAGRRRLVGSVPALLKLAEDSDAKNRAAASKRLGELAAPSDLPALLQLLNQGQDVDAAEQAIAALCGRLPDAEAEVDKVIALLDAAKPAQKSALLRILGIISGEKALKSSLAAVGDGNGEVHDAAIRVVCEWKTSEPASEVLKFAKAAKNATEKRLCLRSYLGWARNSDQGAEKQLAMCREAASLADSTEDKKLLLGVLGGINTVEAVEMIRPHFDNAAVAEDAVTAVAAISDALLKSGDAAKLAAKLVEPLQNAQKATPNAELSKRTGELLKLAQSKSGK